MGIGQILGPLRRRWYLLVLGLLLTAGLSYAGLTLTPPSYEASGSVLLLPSREQMASGGRNPFLQLGNLDAPASIVIARLNGDETHNIIEAASPTAEYFVENDPTMRGPAIQVTVTDRSGESTLAILNQLLDLVGASLAGVQAEREVPNAAVVGSMRLVVDTEAERLSSDTMRTTVAALGIGLAATALLVFTADALILRRRQRAAEAAVPVDAAAEPVRTKIQKPRAATRLRPAPTAAAESSAPVEATGTADATESVDPDSAGPAEPAPADETDEPAESGVAGALAEESEPTPPELAEAADEAVHDDRPAPEASVDPEDQDSTGPAGIHPAGRVR